MSKLYILYYIIIFFIYRTTGNFEAVEDDIRPSADDTVDIDNDISEVSEVPRNDSHYFQTFKHKKTKVTPFQSSLIEHLKKNDERDSDPDRNLVLSFLPFLKKLNNDQKLDFQIHALKYLKELTQPKTTPSHPIGGPYPTPTYYPVTQNMPSSMQYPYSYQSYPYTSQSQSSLAHNEMPINHLNSQYSNIEHASIQGQQYTPNSQLSPPDNS